MTRLLITRRVKEWLSGTGAGQAIRWWTNGDSLPNGETEHSMSLMHKVFQPSTRKDRAVWVDLTADELDDLDAYINAMYEAGRDNSWDADGRADAAAAAALLRKMSAATST